MPTAHLVPEAYCTSQVVSHEFQAVGVELAPTMMFSGCPYGAVDELSGSGKPRWRRNIPRRPRRNLLAASAEGGATYRCPLRYVEAELLSFESRWSDDEFFGGTAPSLERTSGGVGWFAAGLEVMEE